MTGSHYSQVNEELTAEEWKKRYEKKKTECEKLKAALSKAEAELARLVYLHVRVWESILSVSFAFRSSVIPFLSRLLCPLPPV